MTAPPHPATSRTGSANRNNKPALNTYESVIEGYENVEIIGKGSFGQIRKVLRRVDGKVFARKELSYDRMSAKDRAQIVSEVNILRKLTHKNIVRYEERYADTDSNTLYIVMEFCSGGDLAQLIKKCRRRNQSIPEEAVWSYFAQLVEALDACHNRRTEDTSTTDGPVKTLLHRDIKPENIFLDHDDNIKLGDFGLSKELQPTAAFASTYVGTPYYMSPELTNCAAYDAKSDIWALACVIYELCALAPPFDAHSQEELTLKIKSGSVPRLPKGYSHELERLVRSMLDLEPRRRPTTKQLLEAPHIKLHCRASELTAMLRQLNEREASLNAREEAIAEREAGHNRIQAHRGFSNEETEATLERRQIEVETKYDQLLRREKELEERYDRVRSELSLREQQMQAEFDATVQREVERKLKAEMASRGSGASSIPSASSVTPTSASVSTARRKRSLANVSSAARTSKGKSSLAIDEWGNLPRADRRKSIGEGSGQAVDNKSSASAESPSKPVLTRAPKSEPISHRSLYASPTQDRRPPVPPVSARKSMSSLRNGRIAQLLDRERYNPAADKSDTTMKDVTVDEKENDSMLSLAYGSPSGVSSLLKQQRARRITLEQQRRSEDKVEQEDEVARQVQQQTEVEEKRNDLTQGARGDDVFQDQVVAGLAAKKHDSASSLAVHSQSRRSSPSDEKPGETAYVEPPAPVYDISNDPDLPSPFLRKPTSAAATNLLTKMAANKARSSMAITTSLVQKAAALRAAQNAVNTAGTTEKPDAGGARTMVPASGTTVAKLRGGSDRPRASITDPSPSTTTDVASISPAEMSASASASVAPPLPPPSSSFSSSSKSLSKERTAARARPSALSSIPSFGSGTGQGPRRSCCTPSASGAGVPAGTGTAAARE